MICKCGNNQFHSKYNKETKKREAYVCSHCKALKPVNEDKSLKVKGKETQDLKSDENKDLK